GEGEEALGVSCAGQERPMANPQDIQRAIPGLRQFLRDANRLQPEFNKELKKGSIEVAKHVVNKAKANASTESERLVAKSLEARSDRIPKIAVKSAGSYVSSSRPNRRRSQAARVKAIDVWYGIEFGGGKYGKGNPKPRKNYRDGVTKGGIHAYTTQFRPHRGRRGYFFYPTVRDEGDNIERLYGEAVERVLKEFGRRR
ncbi:MAG TPA: hypothetical protein VIG24_05705, partial [Acidimicrobiia bacterium]